MSNYETLITTSNAIRTNAGKAMDYQIRFGQAVDSKLPQFNSSITLVQNIGSNMNFGMEFKLYDTQTKNGFVNYVNGNNETVQNLITIQNANTSNLSTVANFTVANSSHLSSSRVVVSSITANTISSVYATANEMNVLSSLRIHGSGAVQAVNLYNGVRFKDNAGVNEMSIFMSTGTDYADGLFAYVNAGTTVAPIARYLSTATAQKITGYFDTISSINGTTIVESQQIIANRVYMSSLSTYKFDAQTGDIDDLTVTNFTTLSDARHKKNVVPVVAALEKVRSLNPVFYDWIGRHNLNSNYPELGFIAQEVHSNLPNIVAIGDDLDQTMSVAYDRLTSLLTAAVKELSEQVDILKARLINLEMRLA
jgi:hypothetical protein